MPSVGLLRRRQPAQRAPRDFVCTPFIRLTMVDSADFSADFCFVAVNQLSTTTFCSSTALQVYQNQACKYYLCANRANSANVQKMQMCK